MSKKIALGACAILVLATVLVLASHFNGKSALENWERQMKLRGEKFSIADLALPAGPRGDTNLDEIELAAGRLRLRTVDPGYIEAIDFSEPGRAEPAWVKAEVRIGNGRTTTWPALAAEMESARDDLDRICGALNHPALSSDMDYTDPAAVPNCLYIRVAAQWLSGAALYELHQGNLDGARKRLGALMNANGMHRDDLHIVSQMVRAAIANLASEVAWAALQAPGWTEPALLELHRESENPLLLEKFTATLDMERAQARAVFAASRVNGLKSVRSRFSFGANPAGSLEKLLKEYVLDPTWRVAWSEADELFYLQNTQRTLEAMRRANQHKSLARLKSELASARAKTEAAKTPYDRIRFQLSQLATPDWSVARESIMMAETQRGLTVAAIAIQRFELRHGRLPANLEALVPEFLPSMPIDHMDGQPLRYRLESDGGFRLYSVGLDGRDGGGDSQPDAPQWRSHSSMWYGRDAVWPRGGTARPAPVAVGEILPRVEFQDARMLDAIKVLALQAGVNATFDPRINWNNFSTVSIHLENVTARNVLEAVLNNNNLRLVEHSGTNLVEITLN